MADRPSTLPRWASQDVVSAVTNTNNVIEPTESKKNVGWNTFEPPARNIFNWLGRMTYLWLQYFDYRLNEMEKVTDGNGVELFNIENTIITLYAVDKLTPAHFIYAIGYKGSDAVHTLNVVDSDTLTLGAADEDGSQAISGGTAANIIVVGTMKK